jgi:hypothetical protein
MKFAIATPVSGGLLFMDSSDVDLIDEAKSFIERNIIPLLMVNRPPVGTSELLGPERISGADRSIMVLRTPKNVTSVKWIVWFGRHDETEAFIEKAHKRSTIDGYRLVRDGFPNFESN